MIKIQERYHFFFYLLSFSLVFFAFLFVYQSLPEKDFLQASLLSLPGESMTEKPVIEESEDFIQIVKEGEGLTHLARRSLSDYLETDDLSLSSEQKIYIEDFVQKRMDYNDLHPGDEVSISRDLIERGISQSLELEEEQLENLKQYSSLIYGSL